MQKLRPDLRQQVRRYPRRVSELGNVSYRLASDPDRLQQDLDTLFDLHRLRWGSDATSFVRAAPFHREFAGEALDQGWLRLWFLELNGRPVAAQYGFQFAGAECVYQSGRDLSFRRQSIGFVLLVHAIRQALADGMGEYRFLRGVTEIKERFSTGDPGLETYGLPRGATARALLAAVSAARGRSLGLRRVLARL